jgi:hypothetical protein
MELTEQMKLVDDLISEQQGYTIKDFLLIKDEIESVENSYKEKAPIIHNQGN